MIYSVVDIETTGFSPKRHDKIIEIGVVKIDDYGNIIQTFETLVNPNRDVGATHVHGITAEMLSNAPVFNEVSNSFLNVIDETIIVAHNARFDINFIESELTSSGYKDLKWPYICTLELARKYLNALPSKKLEHICQYYDITYKNKHSALADSMVTSRVLQNMRDEFSLEFSTEKVFRNTDRNNQTNTGATLVTRGEFFASQDRYASPLERLIERLPEVRSNIVNEKRYLSLLDDVLLDRIVTEDELDILLDIAIECNLSKFAMLELNKKYLENLIRVYLDDDVISDSEKRDIEKVKKILMLGNLNSDDLIKKVGAKYKGVVGSAKQNCTGKTVCFTGQLRSKKDGVPITRKLALEIAMSKGFIIKKSVISKLDYLVLADVHSQSSKATKARNYGVTLITESAFWNMIGVQVE